MSSPREFLVGSDWFVPKPLSPRVTAYTEPRHLEWVMSYYVQSSDDRAQIDSGAGFADLTAVLPSGKEPPVLLLTHADWDHIGSATEFTEIGIPDNEHEIANLRRGWMPEEITCYTAHRFMPKVEVPKKFSSDTFAIPGANETFKIRDGQTFPIGSLTLRAIHAPGHTPGSTCFFIEETGELFAGDTLYEGNLFLHTPEANVDQYLESLRKLEDETGSDLRVIYPGHANPLGAIACGPELLSNLRKAVEDIPNVRKINRPTKAGEVTINQFDGFWIVTRKGS